MLAAESLAIFVAFAESKGVDLDHVGAVEAVELMCAWYESQRADDVTLEDNGDMLLFQWGTYSFYGDAFSYDLTRQFIVDSADDDDAFFQLSLTLLFDDSEEASSARSGDRWCGHPRDLAEFRAFIAATPATAFASSRPPSRTQLRFGNAG